MISLNLLAYKERLQWRQENGVTTILDPIRKKFIISTPEEMVRQLLIHYILEETTFSKNSIQVEKNISLNGMRRRFDLVIYDRNVQPFLLAECKAPEVKISQQSFDQIFRYNMIMKAPYLLVTNGVVAFCAIVSANHSGYKMLDSIPDRFP